MRSRQVLNDKLQTRKPDSSGLGSCLSSSSLVVFFIRIRQRQKPCLVSRNPPLPAYLLSLVLDLGAVSIPRNYRPGRLPHQQGLCEARLGYRAVNIIPSTLP